MPTVASDSAGRQYDARVLSAVVLSAGESRRMGSPKALLRGPGDVPFIRRIVELLVPFVTNLVVVTGAHHDVIAAEVATWPSPPVLVRNTQPSRGQLSSLWVGMDAVVGPATAGLLMTLVDVPDIAPATVQAVVDTWRRTRAPIVRPAIGNRHGHPVIFDRTVFEELRSAPLDAGAKAVVRSHAAAIVNVPVEDERCLVDVDTPEDYRRLMR
jgi:molybdenum cofactor cytidylyltransferase